MCYLLLSNDYDYKVKFIINRQKSTQMLRMQLHNYTFELKSCIDFICFFDFQMKHVLYNNAKSLIIFNTFQRKFQLTRLF